MNSANLNALADLIEADQGKHFNMQSWVGGFSRRQSDGDITPDQPALPILQHTCGTSACIAGWAVLAENPKMTVQEYMHLTGSFTESHNEPEEVLVAKRARLWRGLTSDEAEELFTTRLFTMTQSQAVRTLRHAAQHHEIDLYIGEEEEED